jgi:hypothetical protein
VHFNAGELRRSGRIGWGYQYKISAGGAWQAAKPLDLHVVPRDSDRATIRAAVVADYRARHQWRRG